MKIAIYARVSTSDKGQDPENQVREMKQFIEGQGWELAGEYIDRESGGSPNRAQFQRLFADAARRRFDAVLFWALDRFSREGTLPTLNCLDQLTNYGVAFRSFTERYLDSCGIFKEAVISILATIAKQERIRMSERTRAGLARARAAGKHVGRPAHQVTDATIAQVIGRTPRPSYRQAAKELGVSAAWLSRRLSRPLRNTQDNFATAR